MTIKANDLIFGLIFGSLIIASSLGFISISPGVIFVCLTAIYCSGRIARSLERNAKNDTIHVHVTSSPQDISVPYITQSKDDLRRPRTDMDGEMLAQIHSLRMKDSLGQSNISNQEQETDGSQTMNSLKALQGMKDVTN